MDLQDRLVESAQEIFSTMLMLEVNLHDVDETTDNVSLSNGISGVIGFAGTHKGLLAIHLPEDTAIGVTSSFLGMEVESLDADVEDAVGELANMLGGSVKSILSEKGRDIDLSIPSTVKGENYNFHVAKTAMRHFLQFSSIVGDFSIELQLEK